MFKALLGGGILLLGCVGALAQGNQAAAQTWIQLTPTGGPPSATIILVTFDPPADDMMLEQLDVRISTFLPGGSFQRQIGRIQGGLIRHVSIHLNESIPEGQIARLLLTINSMPPGVIRAEASRLRLTEDFEGEQLGAQPDVIQGFSGGVSVVVVSDEEAASSTKSVKVLLESPNGPDLTAIVNPAFVASFTGVKLSTLKTSARVFFPSSFGIGTRFPGFAGAIFRFSPGAFSDGGPLLSWWWFAAPVASPGPGPASMVGSNAIPFVAPAPMPPIPLDGAFHLIEAEMVAADSFRISVDGVGVVHSLSPTDVVLPHIPSWRFIRPDGATPSPRNVFIDDVVFNYDLVDR